MKEGKKREEDVVLREMVERVWLLLGVELSREVRSIPEDFKGHRMRLLYGVHNSWASMGHGVLWSDGRWWWGNDLEAKLGSLRDLRTRFAS